MINVLINGLSGKMGSSIFDVSKNHNNVSILENNDISNADVVIDFSRPESTLTVLHKCIDLKKPLVIGTTGFNSKEIQIIKDASQEIPILLSYNMSKGIFILKKSINDFLSQNDSNLSCLIEETHHKEKVDSPSGTAIELKELIENHDLNNKISSISINSSRVEGIFGVHKIIFSNDIKSTEFKHEALSRNTFANGAIDIAKLIIEKDEGIYSLEDFFNTK